MERIVLFDVAMLGTPIQLRVVALAVAAAALAGCTTTSVRVVQKVGVDRPRDRIYVIVYEGAAAPRYAREMSGALMDALGAHPGARGAQVLTGLEFDTTWVGRDVDGFGAQLVLSIRPIGIRSGRHGEIVALIYDATLTDRPSNRPLWAARIDINGWVDDGIPTAAGQIVGALAADRLIPPASVPPPGASMSRSTADAPGGSTWPSAPGNP